MSALVCASGDLRGTQRATTSHRGRPSTGQIVVRRTGAPACAPDPKRWKEHQWPRSSAESSGSITPRLASGSWDQIRRKTIMTMLTTLATVKNRLGLDSFDTGEDALLTKSIRHVSGRFALECGRAFDRMEEAIEEFPGDATELILSRYPVENVTAFALK